MDKWIKPEYRHTGSAVSPVYDVHNQVNLIATGVIAFLAVGFLTRYIQHFSNFSVILTVAAIPALCTVVLLNRYKQFEFANVLFYLLLNVIPIILSREMSTPITTTVLGYFLNMCLIVFLFQEASTRIICGLIIVLRILLLEWNSGFLSSVNELSSRYIIDGMELSLILLVLTMYALKVKAIERAKKAIEREKMENELFLQHMTHDLQVGFRALSTLIEHTKKVSDTSGAKNISEEKINETANASRFHMYMLNNFLEFARKENKAIASNRYEEIDLAYELKEIVKIHQYMADDKQIIIQLHIDDHLPSLIVSDKVKIRRIVLNLLMNAINNSPSGKNIQITVNWNGKSWKLAVGNEGKGLNQEEIHQIFLPYSTKEEPTQNKRLGLGLPITKVLTEALGGQITAMSEMNKETLFTVAFPVLKDL